MKDHGFSWRSFPGNTDGESLVHVNFTAALELSILGTLNDRVIKMQEGISHELI